MACSPVFPFHLEPTLLSSAPGRAIGRDAARLEEIRFCLPGKAPGVEGWNNRMLKQLPHGTVGPLAQLLNRVEATGLAPGQWRITKFAMLAKNQTIERPIGLCSVVYKAWLQTRYPLVQTWLQGYEKVAPWDSAVPGVTCLSVSIARVFKSEVAVATGRHRATLYLDLSTFYETLSHAKLIESAKVLAFPASILNIALQIYRGERIIDAEGTMGPLSFTDRGVIAGCPAAPALSKLALYTPLKTVQETGLCAGLDSWIDDVTIDAEDKDPQRAAQKIVSLYRTVSAELGHAELQISTSKSAFVCTDKQTQARVQQLLREGEPPVLHLVKDLGVDSAGARRRRVASSNARLTKATGRSSKLTRLKITNPKKRAQVAATGVFTAATFGHQGQGISPKRMKVLRAIAGGHYGKMAFGSLDLLFDLSWLGSGDPLFKIILEHWNMLQECVSRNLPASRLIRRTWSVSWQKLARSPHRWKLAAGPIAAMQCYLMDMGLDAPTMDEWKKEGITINLAWGSPRVGVDVKEKLHQAMLADRWERINRQEGASGTAGGIDWTVPRRMLKESVKHPLQHSGLRMLFQGAVRHANHGGDEVCPRCGQANTLSHVLHDCIRWAEVDIGPDPAWKDLFPRAPECFLIRGLVPKCATQHPVLSEAQLQQTKTGIFAGEFLPDSQVYFGTDASGGPKGEDPRLRVVSWAVIAIQWHPETQPNYTRLGTMTGSLQIGATVNDGESVALDQLAQWTNHPIQIAVDSKIAIKSVHTPNIERRMPGLWSTPQEKRSLLQVTWTKGHLTAEQHSQRFGPSQAWAWIANLEADKECGARSQSVFSYSQAAVTENIDRAARATCSWLGKRCAHMLAHDPVPRAKELKFEAVPVAKKRAQKQGLNKRQQLLAATESVNPSTGHSWVVTANAKNLCIKCETCTLFVQQTDPIPLVEFVLQHPCRHRPAEPSPSAKIDPSHSVLNLGHMWSCSRCKASYSVRAPAKGRLANKCKGKEAMQERDDSAGADSKSGFAALFFRDKFKHRLSQDLEPKYAPSASAKQEEGQSEARVTQPRKEGPEHMFDFQHDCDASSYQKPSVEPCPSLAKAPAQETEGKVLSSADKTARAPQPTSKASSGSKSSTGKQTNPSKNKGSKKPPPGTQSVLHFFKAKS